MCRLMRCVFVVGCLVFFFKQKTADEMRISDWSSDVCSSDLMPPDFVRGHFPNIYEKLSGLGIDITTQPIPVVPAQHYTCGGVLVDLKGRTDLPGLYAAGEVTQSGLHGANRLASPSLLDCLVFGADRKSVV